MRVAGRRLGYTVIRDGPASPVPDLTFPPDIVWSDPAGPRSHFSGVRLNLDEQLDFIRHSLRPYVDEFEPEVRGTGFELWNSLFQAGDAEILYALVRHLKPARILEIGSGNSTLVSAAGVRANRRDGARTELVAIDPGPPVEVGDWIDGLTRYERADCRKVPIERFEELESGDMLFIDTTHVVKLGSEVNYLVLEVLPRLAPGVWVHFHDIFLPHEYPSYMFWGWYSNEQYLVHAFLIGNDDWTIELALAALFIERHDQLVELLPSLGEQVPGATDLRTWLPSSLWIRRRPA